MTQHQSSLCCALLLSFGLSGCLIGANSHSEKTGRYVSHETLAQIQPGREEEFVLSLLGEPTSRSVAGETTQIWKWEYHSREKREDALILVLASEKTTEVRSTTYVLFEAGKVEKVWQD
ncbi:MAG: outer membrane protein assembly factor BamE [Planctomycetes bacterium]|nr:outer membrane protein assembly factor BamE [Planctomycetota bacterium]